MDDERRASMKVLSMTGGHRVDHEAFFAMMISVADELNAGWCHSVQPPAQRWLAAGSGFDAVVLHDLPGLALARGTAPTPIKPSERVRTDLRDMTDAGVGIIVLHHALAGWPTWDGWAEALGARFSYAPGSLRGCPLPSSGTRLETFTISPQPGGHRVCAGIESFTITDEPYHFWIDEDRVVPLLRSDVDMDGARFISTYEHVLVGEEQAPSCEALGTGSNLVGWATAVGASPVVVIQPGDSGATFAHPMYRKLLANALAWVTSEPAKAWAMQQHRHLDTGD